MNAHGIEHKHKCTTLVIHVMQHKYEHPDSAPTCLYARAEGNERQTARLAGMALQAVSVLSQDQRRYHPSRENIVNDTSGSV
jgi:hypothetical protein